MVHKAQDGAYTGEENGSQKTWKRISKAYYKQKLRNKMSSMGHF